LLLLLLAACDPTEPPQVFGNDWRTGATVRLAKGTEIREGPGTRFCWHTVVPENGWEVQVTGGPVPDEAGRGQWYDTSRAALGDPSGGTGWILAEQANRFPTTQYGGTQCPYSVQPRQTDDSGLAGLLQNLQSWWRSLPIVVQVAVAVLALAVLLWSFRQTSSLLMGLLQCAMFGVLIWWVADQTRPQWQSAWHSFAGTGGPDLAFALALVPLVWWGYNRLRWRLSGGLGIVVLAAIVVLALFWLAPARLEELTATVQGWFRR
jgi:hypothetical protein